MFTTAVRRSERGGESVRRADLGRMQLLGGARTLPALLLDLQRSAGNRAAVSLVHLQRTGCGCGGVCCQGSADRDGTEPLAQVQRKAGGTAANPMVRRGTRGADVKSIQINLNALGATPQLETDGSFGRCTESAVKEFQGSHRLATDGIVGQNTRAMLQAELAIHGANFLVPCHTADRPGPDTNRLGVDGPRPTPRGGNLVAAPGTPGVKEDVAMLLTGEAISRTEARAAGGAQEGPGGQVLTSVGGIQAALDRHANIGTLAIVSHGGADGTIRLDTSNVFLTDLAKQLSQRPAGSIDSIVFLGCNIGKDRAGMLELKAKLGAKSVEGSNCHLTASVTDPIAGVTNESQIPKRFTKKTWGEQVKRNCIGLAKEHQNCLVGLRPKFKTLVEADPEFVADVYLKNAGKMVFRFAQESGTCFDDLQFGKGDAAGCMRVQV